MAEKKVTRPDVDFSTFVMSLAANALHHMGFSPQGEKQQGEVNLSMAAYTIDIIDMLKTKTKGNLSETEERLLDSLLYELKIKYVEVSKRGGSDARDSGDKGQ